MSTGEKKSVPVTLLALTPTRHVKYDDVRPISVEQFEELDVESLLTWARARMNIDQYLPEFKTKRNPNRGWLCNLCKFEAAHRF